MVLITLLPWMLAREHRCEPKQTINLCKTSHTDFHALISLLGFSRKACVRCQSATHTIGNMPKPVDFDTLWSQEGAALQASTLAGAQKAMRQANAAHKPAPATHA